MKSRHLLGAGAVVSAGLGAELGSQFVRAVLLARMLGPVEFGLVASLNTLYALLEMSFAVGLDRFLVYTPDGDTAAALEGAHALSILRGFVLAMLTAALAWPTAALLGTPEDSGSFALLSIVPLIRGFAHLRVMQVQRQQVFGPSAIADGTGAILGLGASVLAAAIVPDHRAILWGLLVQAIGMVVVSHAISRETKFRASWRLHLIGAPLRFCLPLAVNGLALAIAYQLDRILVGAWLGVAQLGVYSLTLTLLLQPMSLILRLITTVMQPHLSVAWHHDKRRFLALDRLTRRASLLIGLGLSVVAICLGTGLVHAEFGPAFAADEVTFALLGALLLVRCMRGWLNLAGLAIGSTSELMVSNLAGGLSLLATIGALSVHPSIASAVFGLLVADLLSSSVLALRLHQALHLTRWEILNRSVFVAVFPLSVALWVVLAQPGFGARIAAASIAGVSCASAAVAMVRRLR